MGSKKVGVATAARLHGWRAQRCTSQCEDQLKLALAKYSLKLLRLLNRQTDLE